jgi:hypothetical protein
MSSTRNSAREGTSLDLLEAEDLQLRRLFSALRLTRGTSVEDRAQYGDIAKETIRHLATREAAVVDVSKVASEAPNLQEISNRLEEGMRKHRPHIDRVERMSRGVQGINLRVGQDFDGEMEELMQVVGSEIEWELGVALPGLEGSLAAADRQDDLKSARHLMTHAPTSLSPAGPRWWERAPLISRLLTVYDRLRDFPRGAHRR